MLDVAQGRFYSHSSNLQINYIVDGKFITTIISLLNMTFCYHIVQGGSANETSDPVVLRSGITLREFDENVQRAAAQTSIQDCLCQCHWQTFRDRYGRTHGNCKR